MEARIIGPASELGVFESLDFFGNALTREFSKIEVNASQLKKLEGNRFVEIKGAKASKTATDDKPGDDEVEADLIRERLTELGVEVAKNAKLPALRTALDKAEKAKAAQDAEEAETLAEAARIEAEREA